MSDKPAIPYGYNSERGTFPSYTDNRHLITFGPTRSGKGATVIVQTLLQASHSIICIDPKGQNAAITARRRREFGDVFVLNPFGLHTGEPWHLPKHRFNPLAHLNIANDNVVADVAGLSEALVLTEGKDPYFDNTARDLVKLIILHLIATKGGAATLADMRRLLTLPEKGFVEMLVEMLASPHPFIAQPATRFTRDTRDIASSISSAITQTAFLDDPVLADPQKGTLTGSDFTMQQLKQKPTTVFVILPGRYIEAYARLFRLIVTSAVDQLTAEPGGHPTLMILDEFATMQNLGAISKAFGFAAGFNLQCWGFLQDIPQLKTIYQDKWESFIANAGLLQFFTPADMTTAEYLQRRGGMTTGETKSRSLSQSVGSKQVGQQISETRVPLLPTEEMMSLPAHAQIVFFAGTHGPAFVNRLPYFEIARLRGLYDPDPFHV
jgi:type IV secretion system protein VirD4